MVRRRPARTMTVLLLLLLLSAWFAAQTSAGSLMKFGAAVKPRSGQTKIGAVQSLENEIGRKLRLVRVYDLWNSDFPDSYTSWLTTPPMYDPTKPATQGGRTLVLSIKATMIGGTVVPWSTIASAQPGSAVYAQMETWAERIKAFGQPIYLSFNHEPEAASSKPNGGAADYVAAWNALRAVFAAHGVTNVTWTWIATAYGFTTGKAKPYYPLGSGGADTAVDVIAVDGYNWFTCRPDARLAWKPASLVFANFRSWVTQTHPSKPVIVTEFGSVEDPADANRKANWISDAAAWFKAWDRVVGAMYWSSNAAKKYPDCLFFVDTSTSSTSAFAAMGADPAYSG
jgi:hypothetical protein